MRWVLGVVGLAVLGYGALLAIDTKPVLETGFWFVGGTILHDVVLAPAVGVVGWLVVRVVPAVWRAPVAVGAAITGVLALLTLPELVRRYPAPVNPGLHERNYLLALGISVAVVWVLVVAVGVVRTARARVPAE
ncbi:hypothetical protein [Labedaea rhizosphaerae]|uniref:Uncharacterized protein n=1 Tax=Labedaea rhizosphaerae TaxID=598644 RepID=A0A4R6SJT5_LABRH|nr:hypothetical protein [Labedaea rhizosphaerae]TDQ04348.1 hypothetical protein EV186_101293 [Labedaea rhizosphaerae]